MALLTTLLTAINGAIVQFINMVWSFLKKNWWKIGLGIWIIYQILVLANTKIHESALVIVVGLIFAFAAGYSWSKDKYALEMGAEIDSKEWEIDNIKSETEEIEKIIKEQGEELEKLEGLLEEKNAQINDLEEQINELNEILRSKELKTIWLSKKVHELLNKG